MTKDKKYVGITLDKKSGKVPLWRVRVYKYRRVYFVGRFKKKEDALLAKEKFLENLKNIIETKPISSDIPHKHPLSKTSNVA